MQAPLKVGDAMSRDDEIEGGGEDGDTDVGLRYHLNMLYGLRPVPEDFMRLIHEVEHRANGGQSAAVGRFVTGSSERGDRASQPRVPSTKRASIRRRKCGA